MPKYTPKLTCERLATRYAEKLSEKELIRVANDPRMAGKLRAACTNRLDSLYDLPELPSPPLPFAVPDQFKGIDLRNFDAMFHTDGELMFSFIGDILSSPWPTRDDPNQEFVYEIRDAAKVTLFTYMVGYDAGLVVFEDDPEKLEVYRAGVEAVRKAYLRIVEACVKASVSQEQERRNPRL